MPAKIKITYHSVHSPRWASADKTAIDCIVTFDHIRGEVPFTARGTDVEPHGVEIFRRCIAGEFGPIGDYVASASIPAPLDFDLPQAWPDAEKFLQDANAENANGTDRGCVLVWTSMIDELLKRIIEVFLVADKKRADEIFGHNGSVGSFSARAKLAYMLGLITDDELRIIDKLRDIRNDFAHQYGVSLSDNSYAGRCRYVYEILCGTDVTFPARLQFTSACARIVVILVGRYPESLASRRSPLVDPLPLDKR